MWEASPAPPFRFESRCDQVVTYSGDTDECPEVIDAARNAHVFVCECAFPENNKVAGHLIPSEVGRMAAAAGAKKVILTHLYPECEGEDRKYSARKPPPSRLSGSLSGRAAGRQQA